MNKKLAKAQREERAARTCWILGHMNMAVYLGYLNRLTLIRAEIAAGGAK